MWYSYRTILATRRESKRTRQVDRDQDGDAGREPRRGHSRKAREIQNEVVLHYGEASKRQGRVTFFLSSQCN